VIKGEHEFTDAVRARWQKRIASMVRKLRARANRLETLRLRLPLPTSTSKALLAWTNEWYGTAGSHMSDDHVNLTGEGDPADYYARDLRSTCAHCGQKAHGGVGGLVMSKPNAFYCWRTACGRALDRACAADEKAHPKMYAAERKRSEKRRRRSMRPRRRIGWDKVNRSMGGKQ
jgi:hypothetical protein